MRRGICGQYRLCRGTDWQWRLHDHTGRFWCLWPVLGSSYQLGQEPHRRNHRLRVERSGLDFFWEWRQLRCGRFCVHFSNRERKRERFNQLRNWQLGERFVATCGDVKLLMQ